MRLPAALHETILSVASIMNDAHDPWWIMSGAAAAIYGARAIIVSDVDVMLSLDDARRLFPRIGIAQTEPSGHPRFRSEIFGQWTACPLIVEFMANFTLCDLDGVWRPMKPTTRRPITIETTTIFVPDLEELRGMFERFGRPKDIERIKLLNQTG